MLAHLQATAAVSRTTGEGLPPSALLDSAYTAIARQFDPADGGFGGAPKFPPAMRLELLLRRWLRTGDVQARRMVETTLDRMAAGGMYDQVGGGFHRYSVDAHWLVPHFEKMLYDNAMLARVYVLAYRAFGRPDDARDRPGDARLPARRDDARRRRVLRGAGRGLRRRRRDLLRLEPEIARRGRGRGRRADRGRALRRYAKRKFRIDGRDRALRRPHARRAREGVRADRRGDRARSPGSASPHVRGALEARSSRHRRQAPDRLDRARDLRLRPRRPGAVGAALRAGRAAGRRSDPRPLRAGRAPPPPREGGAGGHPGLRHRLRVLRRGAPRSLRSDVRAPLLPRGRETPGRLRGRVRRSRRRLLSRRPRSTTD